jgi:hypothetical protein
MEQIVEVHFPGIKQQLLTEDGADASFYESCATLPGLKKKPVDLRSCSTG